MTSPDQAALRDAIQEVRSRTGTMAGRYSMSYQIGALRLLADAAERSIALEVELYEAKEMVQWLERGSARLTQENAALRERLQTIEDNAIEIDTDELDRRSCYDCYAAARAKLLPILCGLRAAKAGGDT